MHPTGQEPTLHGFDCRDNSVHPPNVPLSKPPDMSDSYCTGHQQQIACMAFSHRANLLATGSWDSTCMHWRVPKSPKVADASKQVQVAPLLLVRVLPVDDSGVMCVAFTQDDAALIACGECQIKVWSVGEDEVETSADTGNQSKEGPHLVKSLADQLADWEDAIPYSFSAEYSLRLAEFDELLASLVPNHGWAASSNRGMLQSSSSMSLLVPRTTGEALSTDEEVTDRVSRCLECIVDSVGTFDATNAAHVAHTDRNDINSVEGVDGGMNQKEDPLFANYTRAHLSEEYKQMDSFHFQQLLDPAAGISSSSPDGFVTRVDCSLPEQLASGINGDRRLRIFKDATHVSTVMRASLTSSSANTNLTCCPPPTSRTACSLATRRRYQDAASRKSSTWSSQSRTTGASSSGG